MGSIVRGSKVPFYQQLYEILCRSILSGEWRSGELLPSESELIEQYDVSRITARKALERLVNEGLIYRERGRGMFVAHPTVEQVLVCIVNELLDRVPRDGLRECFTTCDAIKISQLMRRMLGGT